MPRFTSIWEVTPDTAHPRARRLLGKSIIWDFGDEDSPLGNDTSADTFAAYLDFRATQSECNVQDFIREELSSMEISDSDWDLLEVSRLKESIDADNGFSLLRWDDFIIGLAFAQLLLEGAVDKDVQQRAITALQRQGTDVVLSFRGGGAEDARKSQLTEFRKILEVV